jgi:ectoine hydroxylase-related dioxygenase (phytanoyl-CoA dioxygenase family)
MEIKTEKQDRKLSITPLDAPRFHIDDPEQARQMLAHLDDHGFAVVASVADAGEIATAVSLFWDYAEQVRPGLRRGDAATWGDPWVGGPHRYGVVGGGLVHSDFLWHTRLLPAVRRAFALIWGDSDLLTSFDGGCAFRPCGAEPAWRVASGWWHVDQNALLGPHRAGRAAVQGIVTYLDAGPATGGLCVVPGSHRAHAAVCAASAGSAPGVPLDPADPVLRAGGALVRARAGDLLLWDSRTVHCSAAPDAAAEDQAAAAAGTTGGLAGGSAPAELLRLVAYVCMVPRARAAPEALAARRAAFEAGAPATGCHWPDQAPPAPARPRRGAAAEPARPRDPAGCCAAMRALVGYEPE